MCTLTSADAKNQFGELVDAVCVAPVPVTKYGWPIVVVLAVEEFDWLRAFGTKAPVT